MFHVTSPARPGTDVDRKEGSRHARPGYKYQDIPSLGPAGGRQLTVVQGSHIPPEFRSHLAEKLDGVSQHLHFACLLDLPPSIRNRKDPRKTLWPSRPQLFRSKPTSPPQASVLPSLESSRAQPPTHLRGLVCPERHGRRQCRRYVLSELGLDSQSSGGRDTDTGSRRRCFDGESFKDSASSPGATDILNGKVCKAGRWSRDDCSHQSVFGRTGLGDGRVRGT
jgi:hypothetical protein